METSLISFEEAIEYAMSKELKAFGLYQKMSEKVKNGSSKAMFAELAKQIGRASCRERV